MLKLPFVSFSHFGKGTEKVKHLGVTIRERLNASGNVSYRVECPLNWFNRPAFRQFKIKNEAKIFIDEQFDEQGHLRKFDPRPYSGDALVHWKCGCGNQSGRQ